MTNEQLQRHKEADARAMRALSRDNSPEEIDSTPDPESVAQDDLTVKANRIRRRMGLPIFAQSKRWEAHRAMLARIHAENAPKLEALKIARRDVFLELYAVPVRQS